MAAISIDSETAKIIGAGIAALVAGLFGRSVLKRRWSKDAILEAEDKSGVSLLAGVQQERKEWRERERDLLARVDAANVERYAAITEVARLNAEAIVLKQRIEASMEEIARLHVEITDLRQTIDEKLAEIARIEAEVRELKKRIERLLKESGKEP